MTAKVRGVGLSGIDGFIVEVQVNRQEGLPGIDITGLPHTSIREARYRVRSALAVSGIRWPDERLVANFAPADLPKHGTAFDLPLGVAVLALLGVLQPPQVEGAVFVGELALDGAIRRVPGAVNAATAARAAGITRMYTGAANAVEAAAVEGIEVFGFETLASLVAVLRGDAPAPPPVAARIEADDDHALGVDLRFVRGQARARRAIEIAAAGGHNLLMVGPPGCGKTLLARAMTGILPPLTMEERLEVARVHSVAVMSRRCGTLSAARPFRAPHASASHAALVGGGNPPRPGEVSLAHHGVLFLDEVPEFGRQALEALRAPIEDRVVTVSRAGRTVVFPASIALVVALNPCPCGHLGDPRHPCRCPPSRIEAYRQRLSGPLLDRIDIFVELSAVPAEALAGAPEGEPSKIVRARVVCARDQQRQRNVIDGGNARSNAELGIEEIERCGHLDEEARYYLARAGERLGLSARAWHRVVRVARTIADLAQVDRVRREHVAEALTYRRFLMRAPREPWMPARA